MGRLECVRTGHDSAYGGNLPTLCWFVECLWQKIPCSALRGHIFYDQEPTQQSHGPDAFAVIPIRANKFYNDLINYQLIIIGDTQSIIIIYTMFVGCLIIIGTLSDPCLRCWKSVCRDTSGPLLKNIPCLCTNWLNWFSKSELSSCGFDQADARSWLSSISCRCIACTSKIFSLVPPFFSRFYLAYSYITSTTTAAATTTTTTFDYDDDGIF